MMKRTLNVDDSLLLCRLGLEHDFIFILSHILCMNLTHLLDEHLPFHSQCSRIRIKNVVVQ
jgi:hypothetical protein